MIRAFVFDLGGVVLDDGPLHLELATALAAEHGLTLAEDHWWSRYQGLEDRTLFSNLARDAGRILHADEVRRLAAEKAKRWSRETASRDLLFPGAAQLVREAARRAPVGLVAAEPRGHVALALKQAGLFDRFTAIVGGDDPVRPRPDPSGHLHCLDAVNRDLARHGKAPVSPRSVLALEDSDIGVAAAKAAGFKVVALGHSQPAHRLSQADAFAARLLDISLEVLTRELF